MNNEHHENGALRSPLIFTVPAYPFVVALYFNWLDGPTGQVFPPKLLRTGCSVEARGINILEAKIGIPSRLKQRQ